MEQLTPTNMGNTKKKMQTGGDTTKAAQKPAPKKEVKTSRTLTLEKRKMGGSKKKC